MRNTNAQREDIMIRVNGSQQPSKSHVSHAVIGGRSIRFRTPTLSAKRGPDGKREHNNAVARLFPAEKFY
jgi:hypothetical protein